ncbi:MAG: hypothetical protein QM756_37005 [Polyangiaceae bacterium]
MRTGTWDWWGVVGLGLAGLASAQGCEAREEQAASLASKAQSLAVQYSAEFDVESQPQPSARVQHPLVEPGPVIGCGLQRCLSVYVLRGYSAGQGLERSETVGVWLDLQGNRIGSDVVVFPKPSADMPFALNPQWVAAQGDGFLVAETGGFSGPPLVYRVSASGAVALLASYPFIDQSRPLCVTDDRIVMAAGNDTVQVFDSAIKAVGEPISAPMSNGVVGNGICLAFRPGAAVRIRLSDGVALDSPAIVPTRYSSALQASAGYKSGNFVLAWSEGNDIVSLRIREADGAVLDPDDTFNQRMGARVVWQGTGGALWVKVVDWGSYLFAAWAMSTTNGDVLGVRLDAATGARVAGSVSAYESKVSDAASGYPPRLTNTGGLLVADSDIRSVSVVDGSPPKFSVGPAQQLSFTTPRRAWPSVAASASRYLVAFNAGESILATRVDPTSGEHMDDPALSLGTGKFAAAASNGTDFLVTWIDGTQMRRRWVRADGTLGEPLTPLDIETLFPINPRLVCNGEHFVYAWMEDTATTLRFVRLDASGALLDASPHLLGDSVGSIAVTADTSPSPDRRSFLLAYTGTSGLRARLLRAQTGVLAEPELVLGSSGPWNGRVFAGSDGSTLALAFIIPNSTVSRWIVDAVQVGFSNSGFYDTGTAPETTQFWHDGRNYLLLGMAHMRPVNVRRFESTLAPLDSDDAASGQELFSLQGPASLTRLSAASIGAGRSLLAYHQLDALRLGDAIKIRLLTNDGVKAPVSSGGAPGNGGSASISGGTNAGGTGAASGGTTGSGAGSTNGGGENEAGATAGGAAAAAGGATGGTNDAGASNAGAAGAAGGATGGTKDAGASTGGSGDGSKATSGGAQGQGGRTNLQGGTLGSGGTASPSNAGGSSNPSFKGGGGCNCNLRPRHDRTRFDALALVALSLVAARRRKRARAN